jgi:hypothetical protein
LVAIALALKYPRDIHGLILASGYYYPTVRLDVLVQALGEAQAVAAVGFVTGRNRRHIAKNSQSGQF